MRSFYPLIALMGFLLASCVANTESALTQQAAPAATALSPAAVDQSPPTTLRFLAVDHDGNPITDLRAEELSVRVRKQPRKIVSLLSASADSRTIGVFFDISGSRRTDRLIPIEVQATAKFLASIWRQDDVGFVIAFGEIPVTLAIPTNDLQQIESALQKIPVATYRGSTALYDSLCAVGVTGSQTGRGEKLFIVVGDFEDNSSRKSEQKMMETIRREGVRIFPLLRLEVNDRRVSDVRRLTKIAKDVAGESGGDVLTVSTERDLDNVFRRLRNELQGAYRLTYEPSPQDRKPKDQQVQTTRRNAVLLFQKD